MRILVTGSSGMIGTRLMETLLQYSHEATGIDKRHNAWNAAVNNRTICHDLCTPLTIPSDADLIVHLAAHARVYDLVENPLLAQENISMLSTILEFARQKEIPNVIFASSREVYGNTMKPACTEEDVSVVASESPYAASKLAGEALIHAYHRCYGISGVILRFSNVYGMYDDSDRLVPLFFRMAAQHHDILIYGKDKCLDFTYIDDCVDGIRRVIDRFDQISNETFNIASGVGTRLTEVAEQIRSLTTSRSRIVLRDNRPGEIVHFVADISKARQMLGYEPRTPLSTGLAQACQWYTAQKLLG